jgi:hypothetical protein
MLLFFAYGAVKNKKNSNSKTFPPCLEGLERRENILIFLQKDSIISKG